MNEIPPENRMISLLDDVAYICQEGNLARRGWKEGFMAVGDTHGHLKPTRDALKISEELGLPVVFLGDYVDRGPDPIRNLYTLLEKKLEKPHKILLLRGNHEDMLVNQTYDFHDQLQKIYSSSVLDSLENFYNSLPVAAVISDRYFMVHGGISEYVLDVDHIPFLHPDQYEYQELLWNDPSETVDWFTPNRLRGVYSLFGTTAVDHFLERNKLEMIIRSHVCYPKGYHWFFDGRLLSIFSAPDYCGNSLCYYALIKDNYVVPKPLFYLE